MDGTERTPFNARRIAVAALAVAALGLLGWVWLDARERIGATQDELARRLNLRRMPELHFEAGLAGASGERLAQLLKRAEKTRGREELS